MSVSVAGLERFAPPPSDGWGELLHLRPVTGAICTTTEGGVLGKMSGTGWELAVHRQGRGGRFALRIEAQWPVGGCGAFRPWPLDQR